MLRYASFFSTYTPKEKGFKSILFSENREGWIYALLGIWLNRGIVVPVDFKSIPLDIVYIIKDCQPDCLWTSRERESVAREAMKIAGVNIPILIIDDYEREDIPETTKPAYIEYNSSDVAGIFYTSGTEGTPKGVMLSFGNLIADMEGLCLSLGSRAHRLRSILLLPLHHSLPFTASLLLPLKYGKYVAFSPSFMSSDIIATIKRYEIESIVGVPALWNIFIPAIKKKICAKTLSRIMFYICKCLQWRWLSRKVFKRLYETIGEHFAFISGGASLSKSIVEDCKSLGIALCEGYGMTETSPVVCFTPVDEIHPGSVGRPLPNVDVTIINGEICVKGPVVMQGYYNRPEETAARFDRDGWFHTGDLGHFDKKGRLYVTDRIKDIIVLSNGKNISPEEIENELLQHSDIVSELAVVQDGDILRAIIVPNPDWAGKRSEADLERALHEELIAPYNRDIQTYKKILAITVYHGQLPRNRIGKLQRYKLTPSLSRESNV